ncbi:hypothetical protein Y1Q_0011315 [Alligator mississippiensis]|uniref:Uncharacterized protein n=1 Tax=Alligator mississippiensis TaxID=8496 RepID=A0A151N8B5_ALLMI|nr:hypothetical protein Y1Q_0011315 [Alligator mississippiensis]
MQNILRRGKIFQNASTKNILLLILAPASLLFIHLLCLQVTSGSPEKEVAHLQSQSWLRRNISSPAYRKLHLISTFVFSHIELFPQHKNCHSNNKEDVVPPLEEACED